MTLNINDMAQSAYSIIQNLQQQATQLVGLDALYFRATPQANSEDAVIFQEYTLYNVEDCGHQIKVMMQDSNYQPGDYTVGLFGVDYQPISELQIPILEWQREYGKESQPQRGDIIYIKYLNKLFEITTSTVVYQLQSQPMYFKASLTKYAPQASRRESEELRQSIDDMTVSQAELFGETISNEVADAVTEIETSYQQTSTVSPQKTFDITSVVTEDLIGPSGNKISTAYYDMLIADDPVIYKTGAQYNKDDERNHWIFACWFRSTDLSAKDKKSYPVNSISKYFSDNKFVYFTIKTTMRLSEGMKITLQRGKLLSLTGEVVALDCEEALGLKFRLSDVMKAERKLKEWWKSGVFTITTTTTVDIIESDNETFRITVCADKSTLSFKFGEFEGEFIASPQTNWHNWNYIAVDMSNNGAFGFVEELYEENGSQKMMTTNRLNETIDANIKKAGDFEFEHIGIYSNGCPFNIRNIRLYENEYPLTEENALFDAMSEIARNSSKLIVVDDPNIKVMADFYSPAR